MIQSISTSVVQTTSDLDIIDISAEAERCLAKSGMKQGLLTAHVPGSTASISTIEYEPGVIRDLKEAIERIAPQEMHYAHDARWGDGNGYSHVRAALLKPSLSIPVQKGNLLLGTWQQLVLLDFDNRARTRQILFHLIGE